jgi:hypothetical protein
MAFQGALVELQGNVPPSLSFSELPGSSLLVSGIQIPLQVTRCPIIAYPALRSRERPDSVPYEAASASTGKIGLSRRN